ncbi:4-hydroxy-tetrahydrodipicolinate synthase [Piscinibacterium candidicorallinum]|uniref:4-hydroxy-tetrahydrodipicolinate synthase n=1 Tax=Piscinibacterium candidicorallinum TaxID=1793872 RepID=A0ABV7H2B6_9BURK
MFTGSIVAIVTPMFEDGSIDWDSYRNLIDWHVAEGTSAIVAVGTTGESPTVSVEEHCELIKFAVEAAGKRIPVIAGSGGNSTREAIELTAYAKSVGADASLSVVPYYNKPTQEGLFQHFKAIAEKVDLPVILYDVPGRSVVSLAVETTVRLSKVPGIVGIKDATGDLVKHVELTMRLPDNFSLLSGNDDTALGYVLLGGHGVISVTANIAPRAMAAMVAAARAGKLDDARALNKRLMPLHTKLFTEPNPIAPKWALARMGKIGPGIRLPLVPLSKAAEPVVLQALQDAGVL